MGNLGLFVGYAVTAIFAENLVLTGGIGASRLIRVARKPKELLQYSLMVGLFTLIASIITYPIGLPLRGTQAETYFCPLIYALVISAIYFTVRIIILKFFGNFYEKIEHSLSHCAFNGIVFGVPFIVAEGDFDLMHTFGFALGSSLGFMLAAFLVSEGLRRIDTAEIPKGFRGVPVALIYIGILSLALCING